MDLAEFRSQFPALRTRAYLFAGALTPAAKPGTRRLGRLDRLLGVRPELRLHRAR